jgi:pimeloyl-ACP methyl ester carboxylesterase
MKAPYLNKGTDLCAENRLGNPECTFPIAAAFGDRDFISSENGAERIIKQNVNFASGRSQLFKVKNCTHFMPQERP